MDKASALDALETLRAYVANEEPRKPPESELLLSFTAALADIERRLARLERDCPPLDSMLYSDSVEGA